jgi:hypothetical protein
MHQEVVLQTILLRDFRLPLRINEILALVGCYAAEIGSYRRLGKTCQSHTDEQLDP